MLRTYLKSRLGPLTVTEAAQDGEPGLQLDSQLLASAQIMPGERIRVTCEGGGLGFLAYALPARRGTGMVRVSGAGNLGIAAGERLWVSTECALVDREALSHEPRVVEVDGENRVVPA